MCLASAALRVSGGAQVVTPCAAWSAGRKRPQPPHQAWGTSTHPHPQSMALCVWPPSPGSRLAHAQSRHLFTGLQEFSVVWLLNILGSFSTSIRGKQHLLLTQNVFETRNYQELELHTDVAHLVCLRWKGTHATHTVLHLHSSLLMQAHA